jgi:hypothetical protein
MEEMKPCSNGSVNRNAYTFFIIVKSASVPIPLHTIFNPHPITCRIVSDPTS